MYVCNALDELSQSCIEWVVYEEYSLLSELAITKADMVHIGGKLMVILSIILAFVMVFKALKTM